MIPREDVQRIRVAGDNLADYLGRFQAGSHAFHARDSGWAVCSKSPCEQIQGYLTTWKIVTMTLLDRPEMVDCPKLFRVAREHRDDWIAPHTGCDLCGGTGEVLKESTQREVP